MTDFKNLDAACQTKLERLVREALWSDIDAHLHAIPLRIETEAKLAALTRDDETLDFDEVDPPYTVTVQMNTTVATTVKGASVTAGTAMERVLTRVREALREEPPAPPKRDPAEHAGLHAALRVGQPQIMAGNGRFDANRYFPTDED